MQQMPIDINQRGTIILCVNDVCLPQFVVEGLTCHVLDVLSLHRPDYGISV